MTTTSFSSLSTARFEVNPPVVLAPMAGITNSAFRRLCREYGAGLYVSEMVTSRALVERNAETIQMVTFDADETPRSVQLYGVSPKVIAAAVKLLITEDRADHIDLNMGCPVPKVTRKGGGAALPFKRNLFRDIIRAAVQTSNETAASLGVAPVPVTVKMRLGIDQDHLTFREAGRTAAEEGVAWVALHARTAAQMYSPSANWSQIKVLVDDLAPLGVPVLGNGDIWQASDAVTMMQQTGCAGVVVGRGCLGRPWLFAQLAAALNGAPIPADPNLSEVLKTMVRHAELLVDLYGEYKGCRDFRKHVAWYLKGFRVGSEIRSKLGMVSTLVELAQLVSQIDADQEFPAVADGPRGRTSGERPVSLPQGWLDSPDELGEFAADLAAAELDVSGG
jgi:nifR3 family TIM-barrel protein